MGDASSDKLLELKQRLETLEANHPPETMLSADPLGVVREQPEDFWVLAAHITAPLAYGAATRIRQAARTILSAIREYLPISKAGSFYEAGQLPELLPGWRYRMTSIEDIDSYLTGLSSVRQRFGSLEAAFVDGVGKGDATVIPALTTYVHHMREAMPTQTRGARYLTPDPSTGSACKRWHLMLRWLVRPNGGVDLGVWHRLSPSMLILPLDRHVSSLVQALGLTSRRTVDRKMAEEATYWLRQLDPEDPMRYDMPLCHLGISGRCQHGFVEDICPGCELHPLCTWARD